VDCEIDTYDCYYDYVYDYENDCAMSMELGRGYGIGRAEQNQIGPGQGSSAQLGNQEQKKTRIRKNTTLLCTLKDEDTREQRLHDWNDE
jgi:hypothetical protein